MSRATYLKQLERVVTASQQTINELTRENYELRQLLKVAATTQRNHETSDFDRDRRVGR